MLTYETHKTIQEFYEALKSKDNETIEKNAVIELLDYIMDQRNSELQYILPHKTTLYRARQINTNTAYKDAKCGLNAYYDDQNVFRCKGYNYYASKEPPLSVSNDGRNNIAGTSYLYLAGEEYTACAEINPTIRGLISLSKFEVVKDLKLINFYDKVDDYSKPDFIKKYKVYPHQIMNEIFSVFSRIHKNNSSYYITQYISDYIRKAGYDGIKYWGAANYGTNYTIFNCHKSNIKFLDSKIIATYGVNYNFIDLCSEKQLKQPKNGNVNITNLKRQLVRNIRLAREENKND